MNEIEKRVTLFMPAFSGGGAERVMITLANNFYSRGIVVDLVVLNSGGPYSTEVADGVNVIDLGVKRAAFGITGFARYLRRTRPQVVLLTMKQIAFCAYFARLMTWPVSKTQLCIREAIAPTYSEQQGLVPIIMRFMLKYIYRSVDAVVSTTPEMTEALEERYQIQRLVTIGNPVVTEKFKALVARGEDCQWPWPEGEKVVLSVGRLGAQKDFITLIKAFAIVCQTTTARLAILGEGECRGEIEALISNLGLQDRVWLPGFVSNPFAYMENCDLYVMSSLAEGLPNALIQALCTGAPVVSTRCPTGPKDLLEDGKFGALVDVGDVEAMASSMVSALRNERKSVERQSNFVAKFNEDTISDQYLDLLFSQ